MSEDDRWNLTPAEVAYFREVLTVHTDRKDTGTCAVCQVPRCPDWRHAYDQLALGGELMAEPDRWQTPGRSDRSDRSGDRTDRP